MKLMLVAGARPNFMKIAPLIWEFKKKGFNDFSLIHTGQHYDYDMSTVFFEELELPKPDYFLNVGSGSHSEQTAKIMVEFEKVCLQEQPDCVVVVGDVNSTLACSIVAKKMNKKIVHVESGLRSGDMSMPEEINRIVTDSISDLMFVSEKSGLVNLKNEGKKEGQVFFVGNIMIDVLEYKLKKLGDTKSELTGEGDYGVITLHRPANVDDKETLTDIILALIKISEDIPLYFPIHPRTKKNLESFDLLAQINKSHIKLLSPLSYMDFLKINKDAKVIFTDSGGIQEEATALGVPCFTIRENTERPITVEEGTNTLVGIKKENIINSYLHSKQTKFKQGKIPELWDGKAAERIVNILLSDF